MLVIRLKKNIIVLSTLHFCLTGNIFHMLCRLGRIAKGLISKTLGSCWGEVFTDHMFFLLPNKQC